ncbi:NAD(P)/FAD-dependent oxidoreductase [Sphaerisporangium krabiense]|uniref:NADH dehydrogenase n=1 Tax=Sphaerisporangium krabiense TaxID=763782 RepID=A0A7W8Z9E6_9ACTN|nr:NAD(P)/FAD-dependent oxidoreductase [Sphaerisporangium krabiense]MBB5629488.1 NADH dehydrogenase [Sphaerisporangium krabiense]
MRERTPRVLIVGGGHTGMFAALRLQRRLHPGEAAITLADLDSYMTYQPFLPEAAAGNIEPRHVVIFLRRVLPACAILSGRILDIELSSRSAGFQPYEGPPRRLRYDHLVFAPGSVSRTLPIPGLAEWGIGFKNLEEAIHLRNHVLAQLDLAASTTDVRVRRRALTFVFVGGGYAGVEALAELEDMAADACRYFPSIEREDMRWILVEATGEILPEVGPEMGLWTAQQLRGRGIEVRTHTLLRSAVDRHIVLSDGEEFDAGTLVWTAGVKPNPLAASGDLPLDERGRVKVDAYLLVEGTHFAFAAGDSAAVPDLLHPGQTTPPNAQHAVRQAALLADNLIATLRGKERRPYVHRSAGSVAGLGRYRGVANVYGHRIRGYPAWLLHRAYHLSKVPSFEKKSRIMADWIMGFFFRREIVSLGAMQDPRQEFEYAARTTPIRERMLARG